MTTSEIIRAAANGDFEAMQQVVTDPGEQLLRRYINL